MVRITTNSSLYMYKSGLMNSTYKLNEAMNKLMTNREFDSYASDPAAATRAFKVHSSLNATKAQAANNETVIGKYQAAWTGMQTVVDDIANTMAVTPALSGLNSTNLDVLYTQAISLREGAEAIVQTLNSKYAEDYIFAGADTQEAPFTIVQDVDAAGVTRDYVAYRGVKIDHDLAEEYINPQTGTTEVNPDTGANYTNQEKLDQWNAETLFVDIGLGFELDAAGNVIESTAFDAAISGLEFLGYGTDAATGDPQNIASSMLRLADIFDDVDANSADPWNGQLDEANRLVDNIKAQQEYSIDKHGQLSAEAVSLESNLTQLENTYTALNTERASIEDVDMADAIEQFMWAQTAYNAALQVGTKVIPQTLMDYMQ